MDGVQSSCSWHWNKDYENQRLCQELSGFVWFSF
jgi:hypothetical protein